MTLHLGNVPAGTTLYVPFHTFNSSGASVTISNFAVGDIAIYKNGSTTQRSVTNGFTLLDTDGIDFDSLTGIHGFSVDLSDNTDAGFYAVGSVYWIVVGPITVNAQTVQFVAATFRIVTAENTSGLPVTDVARINNVSTSSVTTINANVGTTQPLNFTGTGASALVKSDMVDVAGAAVSTSSAQIGVNVVNAGGTAWASGSLTSGVFASGAITATAIAADAIGASELAADAANEIADAILDRDMSTGADNGSTTVRTVRQALRSLRNKWDISAGTLTVYKEDDATTSWTAAVTGDASADPLVTSDPGGP